MSKSKKIYCISHQNTTQYNQRIYVIYGMNPITLQGVQIHLFYQNDSIPMFSTSILMHHHTFTAFQWSLSSSFFLTEFFLQVVRQNTQTVIAALIKVESASKFHDSVALRSLGTSLFLNVCPPKSKKSTSGVYRPPMHGITLIHSCGGNNFINYKMWQYLSKHLGLIVCFKVCN